MIVFNRRHLHFNGHISENFVDIATIFSDIESQECGLLMKNIERIIKILIYIIFL